MLHRAKDELDEVVDHGADVLGNALTRSRIRREGKDHCGAGRKAKDLPRREAKRLMNHRTNWRHAPLGARRRLCQYAHFNPREMFMYRRNGRHSRNKFDDPDGLPVNERKNRGQTIDDATVTTSVSKVDE